MILIGILTLLFSILQILFAPLSLPEFPPEITQYLYQLLDTIKSALPLIWVAFDKSVVSICLLLVIACMNFERIWFFIIWLLKKMRLR